jgi:hypothetical protein
VLRRMGHSRALRRSVETRCRVTPKRSAIWSIVMPSAWSACASARRTIAPVVSRAFELSVTNWTMSGLSSPETSSVYDAPFERKRRRWAIRFLIRLARLRCRRGPPQAWLGREGIRLRPLAPVGRKIGKAPKQSNWDCDNAYCSNSDCSNSYCSPILPAVLDIASLGSRPLPAPCHIERSPYGAC